MSENQGENLFIVPRQKGDDRMNLFDEFEGNQVRKYNHQEKLKSPMPNVVEELEKVEHTLMAPYYQQVIKLVDAQQEKTEEFCFSDGVLKNEEGEVCNFYVTLLRGYIIKDEDCDEPLRFDIKFVVNRKGNNREYILDKVRLSDLKNGKVLKKVPYHVIYVDESKFKAIWSKYVNFLIERFDGDEEVLYMRAGWKKIGKKWYYIDGEKALGLKIGNIHALSQRYINSSIDPYCHYNNFVEMLMVLQDFPKMAVLLLYVFACFLYRIFDVAGCPLKFCMVLVGPRGSRKTSLALCFSQIENKTSPKFNFNATKAGMQASFKNYADAVMLIDDLAPSINPVRKRDNEEKLETIIRLFGDAGERVICTEFMQDGRKKPDYSVAGGCLITGEYYYSTGVESSIARTVVLELDKDDIRLEKLSYFQDNPQILESMLHDFLVYVSEHFSMVCNTMTEQVGICRKEYQAAFSNGRFADYLGQFFAIAEIMGDYLAETSDSDTVSLVEQLKESSIDVLRRNDRKMKQRTPINLVARALFDFAESDKSVEWGNPVDYSDLFIITTKPFYYVRESDLSGIVDAYAKKNAMTYLKMSTQEIAKLLENHEIVTKIKEGDSWRFSKKYPQYDRIRMMKLDVEMLKKVL